MSILKMKLFVLAAAVLVSYAFAAPDDVHETLDDEFDFTAISADELRDIARCICGDGKCTDVTASYKQHYPTVMIEACKRCNPSQKHISRVFWDMLKQKLPEERANCLAKHDPQGMYYDNFYNAIKDF